VADNKNPNRSSRARGRRLKCLCSEHSFKFLGYLVVSSEKDLAFSGFTLPFVPYSKVDIKVLQCTKCGKIEFRPSTLDKIFQE